MWKARGGKAGRGSKNKGECALAHTPAFQVFCDTMLRAYALLLLVLVLLVLLCRPFEYRCPALFPAPRLVVRHNGAFLRSNLSGGSPAQLQADGSRGLAGKPGNAAGILVSRQRRAPGRAEGGPDTRDPRPSVQPPVPVTNTTAIDFLTSDAAHEVFSRQLLARSMHLFSKRGHFLFAGTLPAMLI